MRRRSEKRVVITGLGPVTPAGLGRHEFWRRVRSGASATRSLEELPGGFPVDTLRSRVVARVTEPVAGPPPVSPGDRRRLLGELALRFALDDAGLEAGELRQAAMVLGNAVGAPLAVETLFRGLEATGWAPDGPDVAAAELLRQMSFHSLAHELATAHGCRGEVLTLSTGCTAGIDAVGTAFEMVRDGQTRLAIAGAAEAPLTPIVYAAFDLIGALSRRNDDPEHASRPFDAERDGFVLAEGAAFLVLEERERARARGAHVYAEIGGYASVSNSYHMTNLPADGSDLAHCVTAALADAGLAPDAIDFVNAHGSSTPQNDLCEINALKQALGRRAGSIAVNSLKGMIGHALGAANAIEIAACALALDEQFLFPTINLDRPGAGCDLDYVANVGRPADLTHLAKLSSGFSGIHSVLVMTAAEVV
ncbi:MAG: beta-ketoacyl-[acyl-carrier-protein] synthase family protein [Thermoanaerobaculia bacterium]